MKYSEEYMSPHHSLQDFVMKITVIILISLAFKKQGQPSMALSLSVFHLLVTIILYGVQNAFSGI